MYSYGSSARAEVGRKGHGGRPYRPPPKKRRDDQHSMQPPPLKECSCLVELHLEEYREPQPVLGRHHVCFGGRQAMEQCERIVRSNYGCHLMVPGKKQPGPVSLVAKTYREALPALAYLMEHMQMHHHPQREETIILGVRFHRNVKDERDHVLEGTIPMPIINSQQQQQQGSASSNSQRVTIPYWLFQSPTWSVLACNLLVANLDSDNNNNNNNNDVKHNKSTVRDSSYGLVQDRVTTLQTCFDNWEFQLGKEHVGKLDIFVDPFVEYSFAVGDPDQAEMLSLEILAALQGSDPRSD
jgi:hypothetical protein